MSLEICFWQRLLVPGLLRWVADPAPPDAMLTLTTSLCMLLPLCSLHATPSLHAVLILISIHIVGTQLHQYGS